MAKVITIPQDAIIYEIDIELFKPVERPTIYTKQYDSNTRYIAANVYNDGEKYTLTTSDTIRFACTKPDGFGIYNECGIDSKGKIVYQITDQTTAKDGQFPAEFRIYTTYDDELGNKVEQLKTTANLKIWVDKSALNNSTIMSSDEVNVLTDLIVEATKAISGATSTTQEVQQAIDNAQTAVSKTVKAIADTEKATQDAIAVTNTANSTIGAMNQKIAESETAIQDAISSTNTANDIIIAMNQKLDESEVATHNAIIATNDANTSINTMIQKIYESEQVTHNAIAATNNANTAIDTINKKITESEDATQEAITAKQNSITATNNAELATNQLNQLNTEVSNAEEIRQSQEVSRQSEETTRQLKEVTRQSQEVARQEYYDAYKIIEKYDNNKKYIAGNKVSYSGGTYQNILSSTGIPPTYKTDNTNWICIAKNGEDGAGGDMFRTTYDTAGKNIDIFDYTDNAVSIIDTKINEKASAILQTAKGTSDAITLDDVQLIHGFSVSFIVAFNNSPSSTTINDKPLYKQNTTTTPNLTAGKVVTAWYNSTKDCFFIKASAEGNVVAEHVLAGDTFSNDSDTGIVGTMPYYDCYNDWYPERYICADDIWNGDYSFIHVMPKKGYYEPADVDDPDSVGWIRVDSEDFLKNNIVFGKNLFGKIGTFSSDATATDSDVLNGKTYYRNGMKGIGNIPSKVAGTFIPGMVDQTIAAGQYLSGVQTIKGDSNLTPDNIVYGKSIFGVQGTVVSPVMLTAYGNFNNVSEGLYIFPFTAVGFEGNRYFLPQYERLIIHGTFNTYNSFSLTVTQLDLLSSKIVSTKIRLDTGQTLEVRYNPINGLRFYDLGYFSFSVNNYMPYIYFDLEALITSSVEEHIGSYSD